MSEAQKLSRFSMQTNFDVLNPQQNKSGGTAMWPDDVQRLETWQG